MHRPIRFLLLALTMAVTGLGCQTGAPPEPPAEAEQRALEERVRALRDEAMADETLTPTRKAEWQRLAADVRVWQARTGQGDLRVTEESVRTAQRANDDGGGSGCDCPGYTVHGDLICFLESEECPVGEDEDSGMVITQACQYTCIWIGSSAEPAMQGGAGEAGSPIR